jgi:hypothetical protein
LKTHLGRVDDESGKGGAGDRLLMEDTSGKGHGASPLNGEALAVVIALE